MPQPKPTKPSPQADDGLMNALPGDGVSPLSYILSDATEAVREMIRGDVTSALRPSAHSLNATGIAYIPVTVLTETGNEDRVFPLFIRSVSRDRTEEIRLQVFNPMPQPPVTTRTKPGTTEYEEVRDEFNPEYLRKLTACNTLYNDLIVLYGLNQPLCNSRDEVVWVVDDDDTKRGDEAAGLDALRAMKWSASQHEFLRDAIEGLTMTREQREQRERQKNS